MIEKSHEGTVRYQRNDAVRLVVYELQAPIQTSTITRAVLNITIATRSSLDATDKA
jgi:hypothetical protein